MLAVKKEYRGKGIATKLVKKAIDIMIERDADEVSPCNYIACSPAFRKARLLWRPRSQIPLP